MMNHGSGPATVPSRDRRDEAVEAEGATVARARFYNALGPALAGLLALGCISRLLGVEAAPPAETFYAGRLADPDPNVRQQAAAELGKLPQVSAGALGALRQALSDKDAGVRCAALRGLARTGSPAGADAVQAALRGEDEALAHCAVLASGSLGAKATAPLSRLLQDGSWKVRARAAVALGETGDPAAAGALESALAGKDDFQVRGAAAEGLRKLAGPGAVRALEQAAARDADPEVRRRAGQAAKELRSKRGPEKNDRKRRVAQAEARN